MKYIILDIFDISAPPAPPALWTEICPVTIVHMRRGQVSAVEQLVPHCEMTSSPRVPATLAVPGRPTPSSSSVIPDAIYQRTYLTIAFPIISTGHPFRKQCRRIRPSQCARLDSWLLYIVPQTIGQAVNMSQLVLQNAFS
jgi:hypothetical protein